MNFLALCQGVHREGGVSGSGLTTTVSQAGILLKIVEWTNRAYQDIQKLHDDWDFRQSSKNFQTISGTGEYLSQVSDVNKVDTEKVTSYLTTTGVGDERQLWFIDFDRFHKAFLVGTQNDSTPEYFTIGNDGALIFGPVPDAAYTVTFYYTKTIDVLSGNTDIPILPSDYHEIIQWKACIYYAKYLENENLMQMFRENYRESLKAMRLTQRAKMVLASRPLI